MHLYLSVNKTSPVNWEVKVVDYRARAGAGARAGARATNLTSWNRSLAKMEQLHNAAEEKQSAAWHKALTVNA